MKTQIKEVAEKLNNLVIPEHKHVVAPVMDVCDMFAQGDIGILRIKALPRGAKKMERPIGGQIAPGNTKGSRHCVDTCDATFYSFAGDEMSDICIEAREDWTLLHPEHGHVTFKPGLYQFVHQQNEKNQRVRD